VDLEMQVRPGAASRAAHLTDGLTLLDRLARACTESDDLREGRRAFLEKRRPVFAGR
jgi:enoyl-CoA hydratase/carnithine racemase